VAAVRPITRTRVVGTRPDSLARSRKRIRSCCAPDHSHRRSRDSTCSLTRSKPRAHARSTRSHRVQPARSRVCICGCCVPDHSHGRGRDSTHALAQPDPGPHSCTTRGTRARSPLAHPSKCIRGCSAPDHSRLDSQSTWSHRIRLGLSRRCLSWLQCARSFAQAQVGPDSITLARSRANATTRDPVKLFRSPLFRTLHVMGTSSHPSPLLEVSCLFMSFVGAWVPVTRLRTLLITLGSARVCTTVPYLD